MNAGFTALEEVKGSKFGSLQPPRYGDQYGDQFDPSHTASRPTRSPSCRRRLNFEPPRRPNIEPGVEAERVIVGCG